MARGVTVQRVGQACVRTVRWTFVMLRNGRLPAGIGALALAAILTFLVTDKQFSVNRVVVSGVVSVSGTTVAQATGVLGQSIFDVDAAAVAQRVASLPSVRHADVSTAVPGTLIVRIDERQPALIWDAPNQSYLVDETGFVLGLADPHALPTLPHLTALAGVPVPVVGQQISSEPVQATLALNARVPLEAGLTRASIALDPLTGIIVQTPEWRAVIGNDDLLGRKLAILKLLLRDHTWTDADIRDPDRPVLRKQ